MTVDDHFNITYNKISRFIDFKIFGIDNRCANDLCVQKAWLCDREDDCGDNSDETNCANHTCNSNQFTCSDGYCVPRSYMCDGEDDCSDSSDEDPVACGRTPAPSCPRRSFSCGNGTCVALNKVCDGHEDCVNGADEWRCKHGACRRPDLNQVSFAYVIFKQAR